MKARLTRFAARVVRGFTCNKCGTSISHPGLCDTCKGDS